MKLIFDIKHWLVQLKRFWRPGEWSAYLLGLSLFKGSGAERGLILIQIDGLSKSQLEKAFKENRMPFLEKLLTRQGYRCIPFYPGLPSSTPSVQGELFYGVKQVVPTFSFFDKEDGRLARMYDGPAAQKVERELQERGEALLAGGSSYSNVYSGGASESHFCAVSLGWNQLWTKIHPIRWAILVLTHVFFFSRLMILLAWEFIIAFLDFVIGIAKGESIGKELKFIPTRLAICILMRDLIVLGARIDIARGLPVIHMNFLGYDEQAHRRGPSSMFAHWALKGIDNAIAKIYRAARRSKRRHYDVWVYSDHGQEHTLSYLNEYGRPVQEAIKESFLRIPSVTRVLLRYVQGGIQLQRARYFGKQFQKRILALHDPKTLKAKEQELVVTAMGPLGHIYLPLGLEKEEVMIFAKDLVHQAKIPMVLSGYGPGRIRVWNERGTFILPDESTKIFPEAYPYREEIVKDLVALCHHKKAGDILFSGWRHDGPSLSFPVENGAHAGPGKEETNAFALVPSDVIRVPKERSYIYAQDLRGVAIEFLRSGEKSASVRSPLKPSVPKRPTKTIRIMTYNVHSCVGMDGKIAPERIARVIARHEPDIVAMQELDTNKLRTKGVDQPHEIAKFLEMYYHFHPTIQIEEELYGNAILSRYPLTLVKADQLPQLPSRAYKEIRSALWVKVAHPSQEINVINTHLSLSRRERVLQAKKLVGKDWVNHHDCQGPVILCGDLNALPRSPVCRLLEKQLTNAVARKADFRNRATWMSHYPMGKIDHIFVSPGMEVKKVKVSRTDLDKASSDHLPLIVDVRLPLEDRIGPGERPLQAKEKSRVP